MKIVLNRLREPSTWAGLGLLAGAVLGLDPSKAAAVAQVVNAIAPLVPTDGGHLAQIITAAAGGLAFLLPERARTAAPAQPTDE